MNEEQLIQWHPAFYASIQIELENYENDLSFEREHPLSSKPMLIDVLISQKDIRNPLSLLAHNRITALRFVRWSLKSPPDTRNSPYPPLSALRT